MNGDEQNRLVAVLHEVNMLLGSDDPGNVGRDATLDKVKGLCQTAGTIAAGKASDDLLAAVPNMLHPQTNATFKLGVPDFPPEIDDPPA